MCTISGHGYEDVMYIWRGISYLVCTSFQSASPVDMFVDRVADCVHVCQDMPLSLPSLSKLSHVCILGQNEHWLIWEVTHALHSGAKSWFSWWSQKCKQHNSYRAYCLWLTAWVQGRWLCLALLCIALKRAVDAFDEQVMPSAACVIMARGLVICLSQPSMILFLAIINQTALETSFFMKFVLLLFGDLRFKSLICLGAQSKL